MHITEGTTICVRNDARNEKDELWKEGRSPRSPPTLVDRKLRGIWFYYYWPVCRKKSSVTTRGLNWKFGKRRVKKDVRKNSSTATD